MKRKGDDVEEEEEEEGDDDNDEEEEEQVFVHAKEDCICCRLQSHRPNITTASPPANAVSSSNKGRQNGATDGSTDGVTNGVTDDKAMVATDVERDGPLWKEVVRLVTNLSSSVGVKGNQAGLLAM